MKTTLLILLIMATAFAATPTGRCEPIENGKPELISGTVTHVSKDGIFLKATLIPENYKQLVEAEIAEQRKWRSYSAIDAGQFTKSLGEIFLKGDFPDLVDGADWKGKARADGRFQFTTVTGATRTVPKWVQVFSK
jgi:hypothetical protein